MIKSHLSNKFEKPHQQQAAELFGPGHEVYHENDKKFGQVATDPPTAGQLVFVRWVNESTGQLNDHISPVPMHRLRNLTHC